MPLAQDDIAIAIVDLNDASKQVPVASGSVISSSQLGFLMLGITPSGTSSFVQLDSSGILKITGSITSTPSGIQTVTGSITVPNLVNITGSVGLSQTATVTGSVQLIGTSTITGSVGITNFPVTQSITGSVALSQIATVTGSITVPNLVTITGSVSSIGTSTITGSVTIDSIPVTSGSAVTASSTGILAAAVNQNNKITFLSVDSQGRLAVSVAPNVTSASVYFTTPLSGSSGSSMLVDGSTTQISYSFSASATKTRYINKIAFIAIATDLQMNGTAFMKNNSTLTNGVKVDITASGVPAQLFNMKVSTDFLAIGNIESLNQVDVESICVFGFEMGGNVVLQAGSTDRINVIIRDDLTTTGNRVLKAYARGYEQ
jgi:hypothetical protein